MEIVKNDSNLMDMDAAAAFLNIQKSTLYQLCMRRQIPCVKIGKLNRFRRQDLDQWIADRLQAVSNG
ncbi:MAG: Helix-turn-helix domain protein [Candidatus Brocadiaceae bacterium]|nr:Helix-turn-helix domain protein [Candidatus Brocadiaceae bacterium]